MSEALGALLDAGHGAQAVEILRSLHDGNLSLVGGALAALAIQGRAAHIPRVDAVLAGCANVPLDTSPTNNLSALMARQRARVRRRRPVLLEVAQRLRPLWADASERSAFEEVLARGWGMIANPQQPDADLWNAAADLVAQQHRGRETAPTGAGLGVVAVALKQAVSGDLTALETAQAVTADPHAEADAQRILLAQHLITLLRERP